MRKRLYMLTLAAFFAWLCVGMRLPALAEPRVYTFGGSGYDMLSDIAAGADGRIVMTGSTNSTDGTLASRTKSGHSGWALCIDAQGNVLWSFCSRLGTQDRMDAPVFHEDGSVTVVLCANHGEDDHEYELIRLGAGGEVIERGTMLRGANVGNIVKANAAGAGYVLRENERQSIDPIRYTLFDFTGARVRELDWIDGGLGRTYAFSEGHVIRYRDGEAVLSAMDKQGNETVLREVSDMQMLDMPQTNYRGMVSLPDGGAVAAGYVNDGGWDKGRLTRWDAQGNQAFDWWVDTLQFFDLVRTQRGFAALACPAERDTDPFPQTYDWTLVCFDENGVQTGSLPLGQTDSISGRMASLSDGGVAVVQMVGDGWLGNDVRVTIVPGEDIP